MRDDNSCLLDMLIAARKIQKFIAELPEADFRQSDLHQSALIREFQVIGEAARLITDASNQKYLYPNRVVKNQRNAQSIGA